ncbi:MAG: hypothetical protein NUV61_04415 [Candidatus Azambacteria bacterium]|nr:hypothetical protein [Candidatus Azambacteria bacterium]
MKRNPHHDLLGKNYILNVYKDGGLTFADDKIVDSIITRAWFYGGPKLIRAREVDEQALEGNPRHRLIMRVFEEIKKEIAVAVERRAAGKEIK